RPDHQKDQAKGRGIIAPFEYFQPQGEKSMHRSEYVEERSQFLGLRLWIPPQKDQAKGRGIIAPFEYLQPQGEKSMHRSEYVEERSQFLASRLWIPPPEKKPTVLLHLPAP
ncbi:hypothetical protein CRENBAI_010817, partial [Crenichthys baileyi]